MQKSLLVMLGLAILIEALLGLGILFAPEKMMSIFHLGELTTDIQFLAVCVGWFAIGITAVTGIAAYWVYTQRDAGRTLSIALGIFWIGVGIHLACAFHRPEQLVMDSLKGLLILIFALRWEPQRKL